MVRWEEGQGFVFYFVLFLFLFCAGVLKKARPVVGPWANDVISLPQFLHLSSGKNNSMVLFSLGTEKV